MIKLKRAGHSYRQIAELLGTTRGVVAGALHRVGVIHAALHRRRAAQRLPPMSVNLTFTVGEPIPNGRDDGCQWLHDEPRLRLFCGHERALGASYCSHHVKRVYTLVGRP